MAPHDLAVKTRQLAQQMAECPTPATRGQAPVLSQRLVIPVFKGLKVDAPLGKSVAKSEARKKKKLCVDLFVVEPAAKRAAALSRGSKPTLRRKPAVLYRNMLENTDSQVRWFAA